MGKKVQAVKGMNDLLPVVQKDWPITSAFWLAFEQKISTWAEQYAYQFIRTPIIEPTGLFVRSIGEETDVVGKEMYTFDDYGESLSLRPEGTASCLRAVVEHNLLYNGPMKLWYMGPMFRHEKPQKGRYRQFHQVGCEALGYSQPDVDAEMIVMTADLWKQLGILDKVELQINTLGVPAERAAHRAALVAYLQQHEAQLDEDSKRRMHTNPLRVLDTKNPDLQDIANSAPRLMDFLGEESLAHHQAFKALLDSVGVAYVENPRLVRGLDYYNKTVFEWVTSELGSQGTICGGGRYDGLIEELGGKEAPAIGFAMGIERLLLLVQQSGQLDVAANLDVFVMYQGEGTMQQALTVATLLRQASLKVSQYSGTQSLKAQMKKADGSGARFAVIIGEEELASGQVSLKDLRGDKGQLQAACSDLVQQLQQWMV